MLNTVRKIIFVSLAAMFVLSACATPTTKRQGYIRSRYSCTRRYQGTRAN